jgi:hypothetical protein
MHCYAPLAGLIKNDDTVLVFSQKLIDLFKESARYPGYGKCPTPSRSKRRQFGTADAQAFAPPVDNLFISARRKVEAIRI